MHLLLSFLPFLTITVLAAPQSIPLTSTDVPVTNAPAAAASSAAPSLNSAASASSASFASEYAALTSEFGSLPTTTGPDECGPLVVDPSVPDTCSSPVLLSPKNAPAAYGVQCLNDTLTTPLNTTACIAPIKTLCAAEWQYPGQWIWASAPGCTIGSFLPPFGNSARYPDQFDCEELIYVSMINECDANGVGYNIAAVNLKQLPDNTAGTYGAGKQVNQAYGSYIVSERQLRNLSDAQGCTTYQGDPSNPHVAAKPVTTDCATAGKGAIDLKLVAGD